MKRRNFIKAASGLFVPMLLLPRKSIGQVFNRSAGYRGALTPMPAAGGGGGSNTWATVTFPQGFEQNSGNAGTGNGIKITIGGANITITDMAAWAFADGFETTVSINIYDSSCVFITGAVATPNISANDGAFHWAAVTTPPTLTAGGVYFISCASYFYWTNATFSTTGAATCNDGVFNGCGLQSYGTNHGSGPLNFKYT